MKLLITLMLATLTSSTYAQNYHLKATTIESITESGKHYSPFSYTLESGFIRLEKHTLSVNAANRAERVYTLDFEPVETKRGLYFTARFGGRNFECWYNVDDGWLLVQRGAYLNYYYFGKID